MALFIASSSALVAVSALVLCTFMTFSLGGKEKCTYPTNVIPYVTFMGVRLPNHSYVDIQQLGNASNGSNVLQCHTDLSSCCNPAADSPVSQLHTGRWVLPNGKVVSPELTEYSVRELEQRIDLVYSGNPGTSEYVTTGIFRCDVPTNSVQNDADTDREGVFVGIYEGDGKFNYCNSCTTTFCYTLVTDIS